MEGLTSLDSLSGRNDQAPNEAVSANKAAMLNQWMTETRELLEELEVPHSSPPELSKDATLSDAAMAVGQQLTDLKSTRLRFTEQRHGELWWRVSTDSGEPTDPPEHIKANEIG